jgi:hypothetical protein
MVRDSSPGKGKLVEKSGWCGSPKVDEVIDHYDPVKEEEEEDLRIQLKPTKN